ncbi:MAG: nucleoside-diphosphate kinase [Candidatus Nomurabacteria bacterium]|jgi:nucleoside-diphosphate kinase|nr:nucleoside-diphosphate kinase [Candidatus Nomurabacteria bacterium]
MAKNTTKEYDKGLNGTIFDIKHQRTFCLIKPDGVMRGLIGEIIGRIEKSGLKIVAAKMLVPDEELIKAHYPTSDEKWIARLGTKAKSGLEGLPLTATEVYGTDNDSELGQNVVSALIQYMQSGPVFAMVVEGLQAIEMVRKLAGHTLPFKAEMGTIRGDFSVDNPVVANVEGRSIHNLFHASENQGEAEHEIKLWFGGEVICDYSLASDDIMYCKHY